MGLGRVYHPRSGALSVIGSGSSAHLQLVELICAAGESQSPLGSDHQPPVFALGGGAPDHSWRRKTSQHAEANKSKMLLGAIHALINRFKSTAEQFKLKSVWQLVCEHILATVARFRPKILSLLAPPSPAVLPDN